MSSLKEPTQDAQDKCDAVRQAVQDKHNGGNAYAEWKCTGFKT